jgi:DNA-binding response OmpR family regulator
MPNPRILVVEDEILIAEDLQVNLRKLGYDVVGSAVSGSEAVKKACENKPDLVLMDVRLQGAMDGVEAARRIRSHADVPIIYITAHAAVLASLELGHRCTSLAKPFSPAQLRSAIEAILGRNAPKHA